MGKLGVIGRSVRDDVPDLRIIRESGSIFLSKPGEIFSQESRADLILSGRLPGDVRIRRLVSS